MLSRSSQAKIVSKYANRFGASANRGAPAKISFIERKAPDAAYIGDLLAHCEACNQWANRGPLYYALAESYKVHMNLPADVAVTPCANGGIALEALGRFHDIKMGRRLRWVASAFSFSNLGRGYFTDMQFVDCDATGMLSLAQLAALEPDTFDGFVVTNIFGLWRDFEPYIAFARKSGKAMLIDNAAGIDERVADWPYQSFSLHHTKPYGAGEGGFFVSPRHEAEAIYALLNYGDGEASERAHWLNNGKLSEIACAYQLDRLARYADWAPKYREQAARVATIAHEAGLRPLIAKDSGAPATSRPFLAPTAIPLASLRQSTRLHFGKYYKPLSSAGLAGEIFKVLANIPTHPDVEQLSDRELAQQMQSHLLENRGAALE